jgi:ribonuclease HI
MTSPQGDLFPGRLLNVFTDGASRGNPGHAGIGGIIEDEKGAILDEWNDYLGICTNNVAEYRALLSSLPRLLSLNPSGVRFHLDSELVVRQLNGQYKVKDAKMKELYDEVRRQIGRFPGVSFRHVTRDKNSRADQLANEAIDRALLKSQAP